MYMPCHFVLFSLRTSFCRDAVIQAHPFCRDPAVRLGSFGFKKVKKNLKAVRVVSVPLRFGSSRFKKRFGSMSAFRVLPESNSNLAISFQLWHDFFRTSLAVPVFGCLAGYLGWLAVNVSF